MNVTDTSTARPRTTPVPASAGVAATSTASTTREDTTMTTTQITDIAALLDLSAFYGDYAADYDTDAVERDYVAALDAAAGEGVHVTVSGLVYADIDQAERARGIDWKDLADGIDVTAIAEHHTC